MATVSLEAVPAAPVHTLNAAPVMVHTTNTALATSAHILNAVTVLKVHSVYIWNVGH